MAGNCSDSCMTRLLKLGYNPGSSNYKWKTRHMSGFYAGSS